MPDCLNHFRVSFFSAGMFIVINIIGTNERGKNAEITGLILHRIVRIHGKQNTAIVRDFNSNKEK